MKIAVICLAYLRQTLGVELLNKYFSHVGVDMYVHVDAKVDDSVYRDFAAVGGPNFRLVPNRLPIFWGGFNTVRCMVGCIEFARLHCDYDRYLIVTEDSLPIVSRGEFLDRMSSNVEYIDIRVTASQKVRERYSGWYYFDSFATNPRTSGPMARSFVADDLLALERMTRIKSLGKVQLAHIFHGSGWCGLSAGAVGKIIESYNLDGRLRESFEFSAIPEEQYFHTILGDASGCEPLFYVNWNKSPSPYVYKTVEEVMSEDCLGRTFLRKIDLTNRDFIRFVDALG